MLNSEALAQTQEVRMLLGRYVQIAAMPVADVQHIGATHCMLTPPASRQQSPRTTQRARRAYGEPPS